MVPSLPPPQCRTQTIHQPYPYVLHYNSIIWVLKGRNAKLYLSYIIEQVRAFIKMPDLKSLGYPCDQCDYKATQKAHLLRHLKSKHEGIKYPYDLCDFTKN